MRKYQHGRGLLAAHRSISANSESVDRRVLNTFTSLSYAQHDKTSSLIMLGITWTYFTTCGDISTISRQAGALVSCENNVSLSLADSPAACLL